MKRLLPACGLLSLCCLVILAAAVVRADNWPAWRGPDNNGVSKETHVPVTWGEKKNVAWKLPLPGQGGSTPAVWGDRIFLTSAEGKDLVLLCVGTDGKPRWKRNVGTWIRTAIRNDEANDASPSPSTDGKHVYAFFGSGAFVCFDFEGNEVWKFNAQDRYGKFKIQHGIHPTPLLHGDRLYLTLLHDNAHWVIALDKATGNEAWKVHRQTDARFEGKQAYTSPCLWQEGDETHLIVSGCDYATAHRLSDGSEVWRLGDLNPPTPKGKYNQMYRIIASPASGPGLLVVPTMRAGPTVALKPGAKGTIKAGSELELWRRKSSPDVPCPLIHEGLVYLVKADQGELTCVEGKTGRQLYQVKLHDSRYRASPVVADGKIYLTARDGGVVSVVKAGPKFELLATNTLEDEFSASPAISNGRIYLRGFGHLYAIEEKK